MADGSCRFPPPRRADKMPGGYIVRGANGGQSLVFVCAGDNEAEARQAKVLTRDEARRIAVTATLLRARSFTLDGEAVVCGPDGVAVFDALHRRARHGQRSHAVRVRRGMVRTGAPCRWSTARSGWRGCWEGAGSASC
jgi:hypothetical protein